MEKTYGLLKEKMTRCPELKAMFTKKKIQTEKSLYSIYGEVAFGETSFSQKSK